jgi:hypothetical protein
MCNEYALPGPTKERSGRHAYLLEARTELHLLSCVQLRDAVTVYGNPCGATSMNRIHTPPEMKVSHNAAYKRSM